MIVYLDTSALAPLLVAVPSSTRCLRLWNDATRVVSTRLLYPEACTALARAERMGRLTPAQHDAALAELDELIAEIDHVEVTMALTRAAGGLARTHDLRGSDAIHLAAAMSAADADMVFATGDPELAAARSHHRTVRRSHHLTHTGRRHDAVRATPRRGRSSVGVATQCPLGSLSCSGGSVRRIRLRRRKG